MAEKTDEKCEADELNLLPCSFKFHNFLAEVGEVKMSCQIIKMEDSYYVWIGSFADNVMNDLSLALVSNYDNVPISTRLLGSSADTMSVNMARRLSKKLGKPVYVSFNVQADNMLMLAIEKNIQAELNTNLKALIDQTTSAH